MIPSKILRIMLSRYDERNYTLLKAVAFDIMRSGYIPSWIKKHNTDYTSINIDYGKLITIVNIIWFWITSLYTIFLLLRVCLVGMKIIFLKNNFLWKIIFQGKQFFTHIFCCLVEWKIIFISLHFQVFGSMKNYFPK